MAVKTPAKPAVRKKPAAKKPAARPAEKPVELTPIDDGVSVTVGDSFADVSVKGRFDLDGLIAIVKRVDAARAHLS